MFERFTDRARKVMALANLEAQRFQHEYIGTEHILLGLAKEGGGVGANVLRNLGLDLPRIRLEVEKLVKHGPNQVAIGKLPQTPRALKALRAAIEEARDLNHNYVGTEHVLLGLLRVVDGVACQVLMNLGVSIERARAEMLNLFGEARSGDGSPSTAPQPYSLEGPYVTMLQRLARSLIALEREIELVVRARDEAARITNHEQATRLGDQAEKARLATQEILGEFSRLCDKAEKVLAELRK